MAHYERFDLNQFQPKLTIKKEDNEEKFDLIVSSLNDDEITKRHALITLNIISIVVSSVCGVITFFLAVEERSASALGFAIDTILDVLAFLIIIWRFTNSNEQTKRELYVLRILSILFFLSGFVVFLDSIADIKNRVHPIPNHYLAVAVIIQSLIFIGLAIGKYKIASKLNVLSAYSDAFNTFISSLMALSVAISITIYNSNEKIWFIDPIVGMFISIGIMSYGVWMMNKSLKN